MKTAAAIVGLCLTITTTHGATASWYGAECAGLPTASGQPFNPDGFTAASWFYPLGTKLTVTSGSKTVTVTVNDRGPAKRLVATGRTIDLSRAAFAKLADLRLGLVQVTIQPVVGNKPLDTTAKRGKLPPQHKRK